MFTGTRRGLTRPQEQAIHAHLRGHRPDISIVIHGDCKGADEMFDRIASTLEIARTLFPSDIERMRAYSEAVRPERVFVHPPAPPLERNKRMVSIAARVIAAPGLMEAERRSGTWATIRAAKKAERPIAIFWPDGTETAA